MKERTNKFFLPSFSLCFSVLAIWYACMYVCVCVVSFYFHLSSSFSYKFDMFHVCVCIIFLVPLLLQWFDSVLPVYAVCSYRLNDLNLQRFLSFHSYHHCVVAVIVGVLFLSFFFCLMVCIVSQLYPRLWNKSRVWLCVRQNAIQSHNPMWKDAKRIHIITFIIARKSQFSSNLLNFI